MNLPLSEYLSNHNDTEGLKRVLNILNNWKDGYLWTKVDNEDSHAAFYTLPLYKVIDIDKEKSELILQVMHGVKIDTIYSDDLDEIWEAWTITPVDKIERKPFALVEEDPYKVTIDGERHYEGDIRKTDISKPIKTLRWRR